MYKQLHISALHQYSNLHSAFFLLQSYMHLSTRRLNHAKLIQSAQNYKPLLFEFNNVDFSAHQKHSN
eukprot:UN15468